MEANTYKVACKANGVRIAKNYISNRYNHDEAIKRNECTHSFLEVEDFTVKITIGSIQKGNSNEWRCITDVRSPLLGITRIEGDIINIPEDDSGSRYLNNLLFNAVNSGIRIASNRKWHDIFIITDLSFTQIFTRLHARMKEETRWKQIIKEDSSSSCNFWWIPTDYTSFENLCNNCSTFATLMYDSFRI